MKSILYVGATLMIGASIYGFVDYKQTSHHKEFTTMYEEEKEPAVITDTKTTEPVIEKKVVVTEPKKNLPKKQTVIKEELAPVIEPIADEERMAVAKKEIDKTSVNVKTSKDSGVEKKISKKRKFSTKLFSRGALDERYIEPKVKVEKLTETRKADIKE